MIFSRSLAHRESDDPEIFCLRSIPSRSKTHENFRSASPPMDSHSHLYTKLCLLIFVSALFVAEGSNLAVFFDSPKHPYLRLRYSEVIDESDSISPTEVAAAVSVLLGFAPRASLSTESSAKLDGLLVPNPFDRPHAVLMLEVFVNEDLASLPNYPYLQVGGSLSSRVLLGSSQVEVQLPVEKVSVVSLNESFVQECDAACIDNELTDLAILLDGSYASTLEGEFSVPLANDRSVNLHISKKADLEFMLSLASLVRNIRKAILMHETFAESMHNPSELITGHFKGIEALQNEYGSGGIVENGMELFVMALTKLVDSLQSAYQGKIVGAVLFNENPSDSGSIFNVEVPARASRWLEEDVPLDITTFVAVKLVRATLAWTTGIILIISTLIGLDLLLYVRNNNDLDASEMVYFLVNMPLTRDTLLYSNVKLD